jgi:predicted N-acetyltransferase YhbS
LELLPLTRKDWGALIKLAKAATPGYGALDAKAWEDLAFGDADGDSGLLLKGVEKGALVAAALGVAHKEGDAKAGYLKYFAVGPKARRRGLGRELLGEMERRLQKRECSEARVGGCPPPYAFDGIEILDTASHCFLLGRGYQRGGTTIDMQADLKAWKPAWSKDDLKLIKETGVRKAGPKDAADLESLLRTAFPNWLFEVTHGQQRGGTVFVASRQGRIVGFAGANGTQKGWFGPMGTLESERGKGVGRVLMWKCLELLKKQGVKSARIPWVGPVPFYARFAKASLGPLYWTFAKRL